MKAEPALAAVGFDFAAGTAGLGASNVVPLRSALSPVADGSVRAEAQARLLAEDGVLYGAWLHVPAQAVREENCLTKAAPTRFHATYVATNLQDKVLAALRRVDPSLQDVRIIA